MALDVIHDIDLLDYNKGQNDKQVLTLSSKKHSINEIDMIVEFELSDIKRSREKSDKSK